MRVIIRTQINFFDLPFVYKKLGDAMPLEMKNFGGCGTALAILLSLQVFVQIRDLCL